MDARRPGASRPNKVTATFSLIESDRAAAFPAGLPRAAAMARPSPALQLLLLLLLLLLTCSSCSSSSSGSAASSSLSRRTATWSNSELWRDTSGALLKTGEGNVLHAPDGLFYLYGNRYECVPNNVTCFGKVFVHDLCRLLVARSPGLDPQYQLHLPSAGGRPVVQLDALAACVRRASRALQPAARTLHN
jgi:hypothetical protein